MQVFESVFPIVAIAIAGYCIRRFGYLNESENVALEKVAFSYLIPCLLFTGTATAEFPEQMDWLYLLGFYGAVVLVYLGAMLVSRLLFGYKALQQSVFGMGCSYSNVTVVGIPVCLEILGQVAFLPMFIIIAVHNLFIFTFGIVLAEIRSDGRAGLVRHIGKLFVKLVLNPITGSLLAGLLVNLLHIPFYGPVMSSLELLGRAAAPMALFVLGCSLTRYHLQGDIVPALVMVIGKLLVLPALVWWMMFRVFDVETSWAVTAVLLSSMPVGISTYVYSNRYRCCESLAATGIVLSSVLGIFSISFYAWLLHTQTGL